MMKKSHGPKKFNRAERMILYFKWPDGKGDHIDIPFGILKEAAKILEQRNKDFLPVARIAGKEYFYTKSGKLRTL